MSYLNQILQQVNTPLSIVVEGILTQVAESEAQAAPRNGSLLTAMCHKLSSQMLRISALCNTLCFIFPPIPALQKAQVVRPILLLPAGIFETVSALYNGKNVQALAYFNCTVVPGTLSLADMLDKVSLLSNNSLSVHRAGATYSMPSGHYNPFTNYTG